MGCPGLFIFTTLSISFHVFSMVFLLISNLGGVTEVENAPWILVSRLFGKFRGPAAIIPLHPLLTPCCPQRSKFSLSFRLKISSPPPPALKSFLCSSFETRSEGGRTMEGSLAASSSSSSPLEQQLRIWSSFSS